VTNIEQKLLDTFEERDDVEVVAPPAFDQVLAGRHQRTRRTTALASLAIITLGAGGIAAVTRVGDGTQSSAPPAAQGETGTSPEARPLDDSEPDVATNIPLVPGQEVVVASTALSALPPLYGTSLPSLSIALSYTAQDGDSLTSIADDFCVPRRTIAEFNGLGFDAVVAPGQLIRIPPDSHLWCGVPPDSAWIAPETTAVLAVPSEPPCTTPECGVRIHVVQAGDYPLRLAQQYCVPLHEIDTVNRGNDAYLQFVPGQLIFIPSSVIDEAVCPTGAIGAD
jgi:LysM repeat protein